MGHVTNRSGKLAMAFVVACLLFFGGALALDSLSPPRTVGMEVVQAQGGVTGFANLRISNFYRAAPRTQISVTMNGSIDPTGTFQRLNSAGNVAVSGANIEVKPAGTLLVLVNVGSSTITISETGTLKSAGNIALGALDSATLLSDGTNWYQIAASNN